MFHPVLPSLFGALILLAGQPAAATTRGERIATGRALHADALDARLAREALIAKEHPIRAPHLAVVKTCVDDLEVNGRANLDEATWTEIVVLINGATSDAVRRLGMELLRRGEFGEFPFATVRVRVLKNDPPVAALSLGPYYYALDLRSRVPAPRSRNQKRLLDQRTYGGARARRTGGTPIPGGLTDRGFFKAYLVGVRAGDGQIEPALRPIGVALQTTTGTWRYANDWLTLRIHLPPDGLERYRIDPF